MPVRSYRQRNRLRALLALVCFALLVPAITLAWLGYRQLQYEAFYLHQAMAAELAERIDRRAAAIFSTEDERSFVEFSYLIVGEGNYVQRSPLSVYPVSAALPGLVSYFQVDSEGAFSTPLLPPPGDTARPADLSAEEYQSRLALQNRARELLTGVGSQESDSTDGDAMKDSAIRVGASSPEEREEESISPTDRQQSELNVGQQVLERLSTTRARSDSPLGSVTELQLKERFEPPVSADAAKSGKRRPDPSVAGEAVVIEPTAARPERDGEPLARRLEQSVVLASEAAPGAPRALEEVPLTIFESEVDPFRFDALDGRHMVLFRNVWRDQQRFVQGAIIERESFVEGLIGSAFLPTTLAAVSDLVVAHGGEVLDTYRSKGAGKESADYALRAADISGTLLYRTRLSRPLNDIELIFGFTRLPVGPGGSLIAWTTVAFLAMLSGGFVLLHRLGLRQIALTEQQQDFVSAVSHELKTPLTSIRMYGEILKAGWASEDKRRDYYDFIFAESERLTRLINNVLRLARFDRKGFDLEIKPMTVGELVDLARSKIGTQVEQAGFELAERHERLDPVLAGDADAFVQIVINLVDNAIKFSAQAEEKKIVFGSRIRDGFWVEFSVRDYGTGVPKDQMKKIFTLFYRAERELTRETVGTGIGLALVAELAGAMGGSVDVRNAEPGAEFIVRLPLQPREAA